MDYSSLIRDVPDFPKPGIVFKDITPLLEEPGAFASVIDEFASKWSGQIDIVTALDARGFIFGSALAYELGLPLAIIRKKGKLPGDCIEYAYDLEYGSATIEMRRGSVVEGSRALVVDDLLATGGTAHAACQLIEAQGGIVAGCAFVIELVGLGGSTKLAGHEIHSLLTYEAS